jgi:hypothetical protein
MSIIQNNQILLGILGSIGSGKSTVSDIYSNELNADVFAFADPLKEIAAIFGFSRESLYGTQVQKATPDPYWGISPREFLQKFGSEICRDELPKVIPNMKLTYSVWIHLAQRHISSSQKEVIIMSDCRFADEVAMIRRIKGNIILIERPGIEKKEDHKSERDIYRVIPDFVIINDGDLEQLKRKAMLVYNIIKNNQNNRDAIKVNSNSYMDYRLKFPYSSIV